MIGGQGEDSCGSPAARGKRSLAGKSTAVSQAFQLMYPIYWSFDELPFVMSHPHFFISIR
ncbi:hypothetical protein H7K20_24280 [Priestia aryabhattai]|uniref:Uncharacterized protein n=1 Tax=Priestia aryabhattai TaxID=412384 RepID=A0ABD7WZV0_PRIAR|nr:hypothetical protein [Priestia aryabhattai]MBY0030210.1 hypothetical protein [Priestia aryabhattai]WEA45688.1 hypothetical protein PWO00_06870 [Priestia aryabhattai]